MHSSKVSFFCQGPSGDVNFEHPLLQTPVTTNLQCSRSVIISMAEFLAAHIPNLSPPNYASSDLLFVNCWCEALSEAVLNGSAIRIQDTLHINVKVDQGYGKLLVENGFSCFPKTANSETYYQSVTESRKRIIFVSLSDRAGVLNKARIDLKALYLGQLFNNETWEVFNLFCNQMPTIEQLSNADVVIMPGSNLSIYEYHPHVQTLKQRMKHAIKANPNLKFLGVCFGVQFLAHLFDGNVTKARQRTWKIENICIRRQEVQRYPFLKPIWQLSNIPISEYHNDQISRLPEGFSLIAESESCPTEIIVSTCKRYFGMQCHPDYSIEYMNALQFSARKTGQSDTSTQIDNHEGLRECMFNFINS